MITQGRKWIIVGICLMTLLLLFSVIGCSSSGPNLVGKWQAVQGVVPFDEGGLPFTQVEFLSGHAFILLDFMNTSGNYSFPDSSHIKLDMTGGSLTYGFTWSGNAFTLTGGNIATGGNNTVVFKRSH